MCARERKEEGEDVGGRARKYALSVSAYWLRLAGVAVFGAFARPRAVEALVARGIAAVLALAVCDWVCVGGDKAAHVREHSLCARACACVHCYMHSTCR